jgi:hypothetical protein
MTTTAAVRRSAIFLLCLLALWKSWQSVALFSDGAMFFVETVHKGWLTNYHDRAREYAIALSQVPLLIGLRAGITDLHQLARLYSLGTLAMPTALYVWALARAKDDPLLLSAVLAVVSMVFLTTSFFIVGEYNTAYAVTVAAATTLATSEKPRPVDGVIMVCVAVFSTHTYEAFVILGPLLALMTAWAAYRRSPQIDSPLLLMALPTAVTLAALAGRYTLPLLVGVLLIGTIAAWRLRPYTRGGSAFFLYLLAAALFFASSILAMLSTLRAGVRGEFERSAALILHNVQLDLTIAATVLFGLWCVVRPRDLLKRRVLVVAAVPLVALALLPFAETGGLLPRPVGTLHYPARLFCVAIVAAFVCLAWAKMAGFGTEAASRRCLTLSFLMFLALLPSDLLATMQWTSFVDTVRKTAQARTGTVFFKDAPETIPRFYWCCGDPDYIAHLSLALRSSRDSAIIVEEGKTPDPPLPDLRGYFWRD